MFDEIISRKNTGSYKWDTSDPTNAIERGAYPLSVADMEFKTPAEVREAVKEFAENGFFCYTSPDEYYRDCVREFMARRHSFKIENEWITCVGGVVCAINTAIRAFTEKGDRVIIQRPVYYPFTTAIENNGRIIADNPLVPVGDTYEMNFEELEKIAAQADVKLMLLCSPHNPVGRVWTKAELQRVGDICLKNNVVLVSDEIHFDIVRKGIEHTVINNVDERFAENTVICTAVSKSFNLAGLGTSNIIIANKDLREKFQKSLATDGYTCINAVSRPATVAAYTKCDYWLDAMNEYLEENINLTYSLLADIKGLKISKCQGTYLMWLDMRFLNMNDEALDVFLRDKCNILQDPGFWFGESGKGFCRLNVACPREILEKSLLKLKEEIGKL
ncbi:MAG: pyridoxal phosphate-dependent aminotransferase [Oscillospiraceae bacterium]|nr:pyridoxal phosphate-dependent aminotransferase [Oscillospiraceae bacterium]